MDAELRDAVLRVGKSSPLRQMLDGLDESVRDYGEHLLGGSKDLVRERLWRELVTKDIGDRFVIAYRMAKNMVRIEAQDDCEEEVPNA